ncbi:MAG: hypothetical protein ABSD78_17275 [Acidimicrobiales bacterium]
MKAWVVEAGASRGLGHEGGGIVVSVRRFAGTGLASLAVALAACTSSTPATSTTSTLPSTTVPATTAVPATTLTNPVAISFSDVEHGLLLMQSCRGSSCTSWVEITADGGDHWQARPAFVTYSTTENPAQNPNRLGVDAVVLASARTGWAYGPGLFVTHDGGLQFTRVKVSAAVLGVAALGSQVWVLEQRCFVVKQGGNSTDACGRSVLLTGPASGDTLSPVADQPPGFSLAPGYEEGTQFPLEIVSVEPNVAVLAGVFGLDVTTDGGRTWRQASYPCRSPYDSSDWMPGSVALDPGGSLWLVCAAGPGAGFQRKQLWRSFDGGQSWLGPYQLSSVGYADTLDAVTSTAAWAYGGRAPIFHSTDGGHSWTPILASRFNSGTGGPRGFSAIGPDDAWVVAPQSQSAPLPTELFRTTDGGRTWVSLQLRS